MNKLGDNGYYDLNNQRDYDQGNLTNLFMQFRQQF